MQILSPEGKVGPQPASLAPAPELLTGRRIGVLQNGKPNADVLLGRLAERVGERTGASVAVTESKNAAVACADQVLERLTKEVQVVLTGSADCGSCTSWSVHDSVQLESSGVPTVVVTTTKFRALTDQVARSLGRPDLRILEVDHPLGGTDEATVRAWADAAVERTIALLTEAPR